jgi:Holliday junction resolvase-like predicted endonuclease
MCCALQTNCVYIPVNRYAPLLPRHLPTGPLGPRKGLRDDNSPNQHKHTARRTGIRGETYAYWYLRRHGYVFVARNYTPRGVKGELDLVGYDGETLAFVEVRTRTLRDDLTALPELSITTDKQRVVARTAQRFLAERHVTNRPTKTPSAPNCKTRLQRGTILSRAPSAAHPFPAI